MLLSWIAFYTNEVVSHVWRFWGCDCQTFMKAKGCGLHLNDCARGTLSWLPQWCAIGAGTTWGSLSWCGTLLAL